MKDARRRPADPVETAPHRVGVIPGGGAGDLAAVRS